MIEIEFKREFMRELEPRNKELMRVFRDMEMVEALGSGMMRILRAYSRDNFTFGDNYIRLTIPYYTEGFSTDVADGQTERQLLIVK